MSATNRGTKRIESDFYATPKATIESFLKEHQLIDGNILEPTAGDGSIAQTIREFYPGRELFLNELRKEEKDKLLKISDNVRIGDFLNWETDKRFKTIITNPPYSIAEEIIKKSFELVEDDGQIIMLLRINFLGAQRRYDFWEKHPLDLLYSLSCRPSFTGKGTDATEYAFFVWGAKEKGVKVIWGR